jgi:hypothetical protein
MQENQTSAPEVSTGTNVAFVEVPYVQPETIDTKSADSTPAAVIRTASAEIEIFNDISETLLACILKEVSHA